MCYKPSQPGLGAEELLHGRPVASEEDVLQVLRSEAHPGLPAKEGPQTARNLHLYLNLISISTFNLSHISRSIFISLLKTYIYIDVFIRLFYHILYYIIVNVIQKEEAFDRCAPCHMTSGQYLLSEEGSKEQAIRTCTYICLL